MGYYLRVFAKSDATVSVTELRRGFDELGWDAVIECDPREEDCWKAIRVAHPDGGDICFIERDDNAPASLGGREVGEFLDDLGAYAPPSGAEWVREHLEHVRVIYAVKVQTDADGDPGGWDVLQFVVDTLASSRDGITHAEREGFYIGDGDYLIAAAPGFESLTTIDEWTVAIRSGDGWTAFVLDPGDESELAAFRRGEVPDGAASWRVT